MANEEKIAQETYSEFKEKIISRTLKLRPDFLPIIESIIENYNETQPGYDGQTLFFIFMGSVQHGGAFLCRIHEGLVDG